MTIGATVARASPRFFARKTEELRRIRDVSLVDRQSAKKLQLLIHKPQRRRCKTRNGGLDADWESCPSCVCDCVWLDAVVWYVGYLSVLFWKYLFKDSKYLAISSNPPNWSYAVVFSLLCLRCLDTDTFQSISRCVVVAPPSVLCHACSH